METHPAPAPAQEGAGGRCFRFKALRQALGRGLLARGVRESACDWDRRKGCPLRFGLNMEPGKTVFPASREALSYTESPVLGELLIVLPEGSSLAQVISRSMSRLT